MNLVECMFLHKKNIPCQNYNFLLIMNSNWDNFLQNLGEWHGSFTTFSPAGEILSSTKSILNLVGSEDNKLVKFRVRRYGDEGYNMPPTTDFEEEYRTIGRQNVFFDNGAFSKGTIQISPVSDFAAEYGFVAQDRRLRFVQLFDMERNFSKVVLIREFLADTEPVEQPPLTVDRLIGRWIGKATTAYADLRNAEVVETCLEIQKIGSDKLQQTLTFGDRSISSTALIADQILIFADTNREILLLPDGGSSNVPLQINSRTPVFVEAGWLVTDNERQRLLRNYNDRGEWVSSTHVIERKQ
jgi:Domain of unknown function (DUF3598)